MLEKIQTQKNELKKQNVYKTKRQTRKKDNEKKKHRNNNDGQPFGCVYCLP